MKKITIDGKTIEISDESYEAFKKQFVVEEEWPKSGDMYRYIDSSGDSAYSTCVNDDIDRFNKSIGNCYRTRGEAEEALKTGWVVYLQALERVKKYIKDNGLEFEPDWSDNDEAKYGIYYNYQPDELRISHSYEAKHSNLPRLRSAEDAKQVMKACKDDYLILLGVKK